MAESRKRDKPYYPLQKVKDIICDDEHPEKRLISSDALNRADKDFGWSEADIRDVYSKLQVKHYHKSGEKFGITTDIYHVKKIKGEDVYTYFYMDDGKLIIDSFHRLD